MLLTRRGVVCFVSVCSLVGCVVETKRPVKTFVECSTGAWSSNLSEKSRSLGVLVWNEPHWSRVPDDFLSELAANATLNGQAVPILSTNAVQSDSGSGEGRLEPAEIVFDASSTTSTGWNVLALQFSSPVVWNSFDNQKNGASAFRVDSAPSIVRLVFSPADIDVEFSELIASNVTANPLVVTGPEGRLECTFAWGVPRDRATVTCLQPLPSAMTIESDFASVEGSNFKLDVTPSELPLQLDGLRTWVPAPPQ